MCWPLSRRKGGSISRNFKLTTRKRWLLKWCKIQAFSLILFTFSHRFCNQCLIVFVFSLILFTSSLIYVPSTYIYSLSSYMYSVWSYMYSVHLCKFRSSLPEVYCKKGILGKFAKFTGKHLCQRIFFNKFASLRPATGAG